MRPRARISRSSRCQPPRLPRRRSWRRARSYRRPRRAAKPRIPMPIRLSQSATRRCRRSAASPATLTPTSDSDIKIEVWLPSSGWNGKFQAVGNGGWAGTICVSRAGARRSRAATPTRQHRHRPRGQHRGVRARPSGEADRLRLSRRARDDGAGEGDHRRVLRQRAEVSYLERLLAGRHGRGSPRRSAIRPTSTPSSPARRP